MLVATALINSVCSPAIRTCCQRHGVRGTKWCDRMQFEENVTNTTPIAISNRGKMQAKVALSVTQNGPRAFIRVFNECKVSCCH